MAASCAEFKDSTAARVEKESGSTNKRSRFYGMSQLLVEYLPRPSEWMNGDDVVNDSTFSAAVWFRAGGLNFFAILQ